MTETQYWWLLAISIAGFIGYILLHAARKANQEWKEEWPEDEHCTMVETKKECKKND